MKTVVTATEMVCLRSLQGCTGLDCSCSEDIRRELKVTPMLANILKLQETLGRTVTKNGMDQKFR